MVETPDWCSDPGGGDDDETYPPHLNEAFESDPDGEEEGEDDGED